MTADLQSARLPFALYESQPCPSTDRHKGWENAMLAIADTFDDEPDGECGSSPRTRFVYEACNGKPHTPQAFESE